MKAEETYYDVLGVDPRSDPSVVRRAYLAQARLHHPDFHLEDDLAVRMLAEEKMRSLNDAWHVLGDSTRKRRYDKELESSGTKSGSFSSRVASTTGAVSEPEPASGSVLPQWMAVAPALCLIAAVGFFAVGFVTGLVGLLAAGLVLAISGAALFIIIPAVALSRSKRE